MTGNNQLTKHDNRFQASQHSEECKQQPSVSQQSLLPQLVNTNELCSQEIKNKNEHFLGNFVVSNACQSLFEVENSCDNENSTHTTFRQPNFYRNLGPNRKLCVDDTDQEYQAQNLTQVVHQPFGFTPVGPLKLYTGDPVYYDTIPDIIRTHRLVRDSGLPNFLKCRIPLKSNLNIDQWKFHLVNYWDQQLVDLLQYGFPLDFDRQFPLISTEVNHTSAIQNAGHVKQYLQEEQKHKAILGPFTEPPFPIHVSPLMVRDKQDSDQKRTIMDLSWPKGASLNNGVNKDIYLGTQYTLHYPSIDNITAALVRLGPGAQLFKIDISRAFRQIKIDPGDIDLLGMTFQGHYFIDLSVAFGYRHGSKIFQRCTDAIRYIMANNGFPNLFNYIDDLVYTGLPSDIHQAFRFLKDLLAQLGLDISLKKLVPPDTSVTCLGILINTTNRTISAPPQKLSEIIDICNTWGTQTYCSKRDLQSLLGSLLYITKCVKPARLFLNRMLQLLRQNFHNNKILLNQ